MQTYHQNARTNMHIREHINNNTTQNAKQLSLKHCVSTKTIFKWRDRAIFTDRSSRPHNIEYAIGELETALILATRKASWMPLDELHESMQVHFPTIKRSAIYGCLVRNKINTVPQEQKEKAKLFKEYEPGFLHMDVTYFPKFNGQNYYLFVAIDRATRSMFYEIYEDKTATSTADFYQKCQGFYPFKISHILTDNGLEFTNKLIRSKKGNLCTKPSLLDIKCTENNVEHRLTKPAHPQTNGMVERVNGTIKNNTILKTKYQNIDEMRTETRKFLVFYNMHRRHSSLKKELKVKTPFQALEKWYELKPSLFKETPLQFKIKLLTLYPNVNNNTTVTLSN